MNAEKVKICESVIFNYSDGSTQDREICNNWLEIAFNVCVHKIFPNSFWNSLTYFFSQVYSSSSEVETQHEFYKVDPREMTRDSCDNLFEKMLFNFVEEDSSFGGYNSDIAWFSQMFISLTATFFFVVIFILYKAVVKLEPKCKDQKFEKENELVDAVMVYCNENYENITDNKSISNKSLSSTNELIENEEKFEDNLKLKTSSSYIISRDEIQHENLLRPSFESRKSDVSCVTSPSENAVKKSSIPKLINNDIIKRNIELAKHGRNLPKRLIKSE